MVAHIGNAKRRQWSRPPARIAVRFLLLSAIWMTAFPNEASAFRICREGWPCFEFKCLPPVASSMTIVPENDVQLCLKKFPKVPDNASRKEAIAILSKTCRKLGGKIADGGSEVACVVPSLGAKK